MPPITDFVARNSTEGGMDIIPCRKETMQNTMDRERLIQSVSQLEKAEAVRVLADLAEEIARTERERMQSQQKQPELVAEKPVKDKDTTVYSLDDLHAAVDQVPPYRHDMIAFFRRLILGTLEQERQQWEASPYNLKNVHVAENMSTD